MNGSASPKAAIGPVRGLTCPILMTRDCASAGSTRSTAGAAMAPRPAVMMRRRLADKKRHACHERVKDAVLEELSPKNVIPPEEPEKVPNPDPATAAETPMVTTGRTISPPQAIAKA